MKRMLFAVTLCCAVVASSGAYAQKKLKDLEFRHVIVTLASGEKVDGYVHRDWNTSVFSVKKANYSFKLVPTPDSKEAVKYTAEQVDNIVFVEPTEGNPEGARWESRGLYNPIIGNMDRSTPLCAWKRRATTPPSTGGRLQTRTEWPTEARFCTYRLITAYVWITMARYICS